MANIRTPSLASLPGEVLVDICVARSSYEDGAKIGMVSQAFRRHWKTKSVRRVCHLGPLKFVRTIVGSESIRSLAVAMTKFCEVGNPDALYMDGNTSLFDNRRKEISYKGLAQLKAVAEKGHIKVRYLYGLIIICSGVERRDECYNILATLMQATLLECMSRMARLSDNLTYKHLPQLQGGKSKVVDILGEYHAHWNNCNCEDPLENREYMDQAYGFGAEVVE